MSTSPTMAMVGLVHMKVSAQHLILNIILCVFLIVFLPVDQR